MFSVGWIRTSVEIAFWHGCSPVNLLHIFRTPFPKNTPGRLLLKYETKCNFMMFWNLFIFVCCESFKIKVKTSLFIKKRLPNFTKLMKRDDKLQQLYLKAWKAKICSKRWTFFECLFEKKNSGKFSFKALLICALLIQ